MFALTQKKRITTHVIKKESNKYPLADEKLKILPYYYLYENVQANISHTLHKKSNEKKFITLYSILEPSFIKYINQSYQNLSEHEMVFLILLHLGKDKSQIIDIMGFTDNAFRTLKSRIDDKRTI